MERHYSAVDARQHLSELLDRAEQGEAVVIERRGTRFEVRTTQPASLKPTRVEIRMSPDVERGQWSWELKGGGARFRSRK
jgi:Antitoxin Phd_YefM, type II toxin-antitoxin system